jgi:hypothetical protein
MADRLPNARKSNFATAPAKIWVLTHHLLPHLSCAIEAIIIYNNDLK